MAVIIEEIFDDDNSKINPGSDHGSQGEDSEGNDNERPEQVLENISDVEDDWVHVEEPEDDEGEVKPLEEVEEERNPHIHFDHDEDPDDDAEEETLTLEEREEMMRQAEVWKKEGNVLYVSGDYERAAVRFFLHTLFLFARVSPFRFIFNSHNKSHVTGNVFKIS